MAAFNAYGYNNNPYMPGVPAYSGYSNPYLNTSPVMPQQQVQQAATPQQQPQEQLLNGGLVIVQSEEEIVRYPVAPGNTVTFKIENQPTIIEKSMGHSQFASPHYERYKLVKEDMPESKPTETEPAAKIETIDPAEEYALRSELEEIKQSVERTHKRIDKLRGIIDREKEKARLNKEEDEEI